MLRLVPLVEANFNGIELAPRETGKTYLYRNVSDYSHVLSGGKATPANLFITNATGKVGIVGNWDTVVFDEIANTDFTDPKALVSIMQGYMQDGKFSRGRRDILAFASITLVGNMDVPNQLPHEKYYHYQLPDRTEMLLSAAPKAAAPLKRGFTMVGDIFPALAVCLRRSFIILIFLDIFLMAR
jgi:ATP-dependent Lon protease